MNITNRLRVAVIGLAALAAGNGALLDFNVKKIAIDGRVVNHAGIVRGATQRLTKLEIDGQPSEKTDKLLAKIESIISGLIRGDKELDLPAAKDPKFLADMQKVETDFAALKKLLMDYRSNPKLQPQLIEASEKFFETTNTAVFSAEEMTAKDVTQERWLQLLVLIITWGALAAVWFTIAIVTKTLNGSTTVLAASSTQIASTIEQQERFLAEQASSVHETTTTMEELGASTRQAAEQAESSASGAQQALTYSQSGAQAVNRTMEGIGDLRNKVEAIATKIMQLSEQTGEIATISDLVADIANQTNMLSLNAAVEAARAGEHGRGFSVVAGEVRKLADQSKQSAEKINTLISEIQASINSTVMVTDEGTKTAAEGIKRAEETADAFEGIATAVNDVFMNSQQIVLSAKQQAVAVQQAVSAMNAINLGAKETSVGVAQVKSATLELADTAKQLKSLV